MPSDPWDGYSGDANLAFRVEGTPASASLEWLPIGPVLLDLRAPWPNPASLASEEYRATSNPEGLQAPNRAQNLRTHFRERRIEVVPRESEAADTGTAWSFAWETACFGRPGSLRAVAAASPEPNGSRVTYRRPEFDEWRRQGISEGPSGHGTSHIGPVTEVAPATAGPWRSTSSANVPLGRRPFRQRGLLNAP